MPAYSKSHQGKQAGHAGHADARDGQTVTFGAHTGSHHSAMPRRWSRRPTPTFDPDPQSHWQLKTPVARRDSRSQNLSGADHYGISSAIRAISFLTSSLLLHLVRRIA
jgi:hypothetical protein